MKFDWRFLDDTVLCYSAKSSAALVQEIQSDPNKLKLSLSVKKMAQSS